MPDPDLDEVDRGIKEAKELAREVRRPGAEPGVADFPEPSQGDDADEGGTSS